MKNEEKKLYTPIVLRTGFMVSYRRTIALLVSVIVLELILWTLAGFWPRFNDLVLERWGLILILAVVAPLGTSTIRDIVSGYATMFGLFDEETADKLKLYRSLSSTDAESQKNTRPLFKDDGAYASFQDTVRKVVFDQTTDIIMIVIIISIAALVSYFTLNEKIIMNGAISRYPLSVLEVFIDAYATAFIIAALSFTFVFGIEYFFIINRLGRSRKDLSVWNFIQYLQGAPVKHRAFMSYWRFHDYSSIIGRHFSGVAFRIVLLGTLGGLVQILYNQSTGTIVAWTLAAIPFILSVLILILPLNSLHNVSRDAKRAVLRVLEEEFDQLTLRFITSISERRDTHSKVHANQVEEELAVKITSLKGILEEIRQQSTWPVEAPMVVRILVTALIPLAYFLAQEFLRGLFLG